MIEAFETKTIGHGADQIVLYCFHYDPPGKYGAITAFVRHRADC